MSDDQPIHRSAGAELETAFDRCAAVIYRFFIIRTGGDQHAADDLMQQLWLAAVHNHQRRPVPAEEVEFWLRAVARNLLANHWRARGRDAGSLGDSDPALADQIADTLDEQALPPQLLARAEVRQAVLLALTELSSDDHQLIVDHYFRNVPHANIGERLGISARAVEGRLYRARQELRARLKRLA